MNVYCWKARKNFGDLLTSYLLKRFCKLPSTWSYAEEADLVMVGSIMEHLDEDYDGVIAGIGKLHEKTNMKFKKATILGLRGPLTAKGFKGDIVLGDPALLADELVKMPEKEYELGIVPH